MPRVTHGSGIGSQARSTWEYLDQMVHQCEAVEADLVSGQRQVSQPAAQFLISPRKPRDLEHDLRPSDPIVIMIRSRLVDRDAGGAVLIND